MKTVDCLTGKTMNPLKRLAGLAIVSLTIVLGIHPAQAGCKWIASGWKSRLKCDPPQLPRLQGGSSSEDNGSSTSVYTEEYYQFTINNTSSARTSFDINGNSYVLNPGESRSYKYNKARGTNGDNIKYYPRPVITLNSGRSSYSLGSNPQEYIVETGNGTVNLQSSRPIAKVQPIQPTQQNYRPYQQQTYGPNPQQNYGPNPQQNYGPHPPQNYGPYPPQNRTGYSANPMTPCQTNSMRCFVRGVAPTGTPCYCSSPYGIQYGQVMY